MVERDWTTITKDEFLAEIRAVCEDLRAGRIPRDVHFKMAAVRDSAEDWGIGCGTVCCIGGWAEMRLGVPERDSGKLMSKWTTPHDRDVYDARLDGLFYQYTSDDPADAACAIDRYFAEDGHPWG